MILSLNSFRAWSVASARSTLERALTVPVCVDVWAWSQCKSGVTLRFRPKDTTLATIKFHVFIGVRRGDPNNGYTKARGAMVVLQTATVSDAAASSWSLGVSGPVVARAASSSMTVGVRTLRTVSQSGLTSMVVGSIPRRTSRVKASTVPPSGVALAKEGVMNCTPQSTRICGLGVAK